MSAFLVTAVTLILVGAVIVSLERHQRLTPMTALITGLATMSIVVGAILVSFSASDPAVAGQIAPRGATENGLPQRVLDVQLPTL